jgi:hypothetical protein
VEDLSRQLSACQQRLHVASQQRDQLAMHQLAVVHEQSVMSTAKDATDDDILARTQLAQARSKEFDAVLHGLVGLAQQLAASESAPDAKGAPRGKPEQLSQISLHEYLMADNQFTKELNQYFAQQFHSGLLALSANDTARDSQWCNFLRAERR